MVEMQAGVHEVTEAREAAVLRHLDWTRTLEAQGPGHRMQEEGAAHAKVPKPVADTIDTWAPSSERPWMNPETFSGTWSLAALVPSRRGLNTKFLLNQSSPLQKLPTLASQHREVERVTREGECHPQVPLALRSRPLRCAGRHGGVPDPWPEAPHRAAHGEQRMIGGKWKRERGPLNAFVWAKPLPEAERMMLEMRTHPRTFGAPSSSRLR